MAYEIPVTRARAELADLINRVVYGEERVVVTRHGKPLAALVPAADLDRLAALDAAEAAEAAEIPTSLGGVTTLPEPAAPADSYRPRFGIAAEHRPPGQH
ncbi:type II toxin-antitoxin system Phd/YefM family antitoxin [Streptomyces sp. DSM 41982]|uniref:Antitoxin n=1 Tax=Streptomyces evansiae TaxID=3075535 RepID=A0ABD5E0Z2_9ACTN|nr:MULTISPECIES: type II toxin-antitoxin system Phd/YefM family antitoxin [unclassified Streptomyces]MDT0414995.1 type II toxin-antitoxin system Phd/YefM family antitoxin [Streptomyces sp. DSM 41982]SCD32450.1 prevent-host-death family protein [Streptomyces sp. SolWspMP-sol7th]